jgi:hypothetical protein
MPLARVARILGHADIATTYKVYLHFFPEDLTADMDRLDVYPSTTPSKPGDLKVRAQSLRSL